MSALSDVQPQRWHHYFAAAANNAAWPLAELANGAFDVKTLLNAAHASAWHWQHAGSALQHMRALMLLAQAHAQSGLGTTAYAWAEEMRSYFLGKEDTPDWEIAFVHVVHALAAYAAGERSQYLQSYALAVETTKAITNPEDHRIVAAVLHQVPSP